MYDKGTLFLSSMETSTPFSLDDSKVIDSRVTNNGQVIRRRRECLLTGRRFTTFERIQGYNLIVIKRDGTSEPYDREKLEKGIMIACGKRAVSLEKIQNHLSELEEKWVKSEKVESSVIGEDVMRLLKDIDDVAYIRFASVYKKFKDIETFKKALDEAFE